MVNNAGKNGVDNGTKPADEVLRKTLHDFARRQLSIPDRLLELVRLHGYVIKKSKLKQLNLEFEVPSVRKPPPLPVCTALVAQKMFEDTSRRHGPTTIQRQIAREKFIPIPRDIVRGIAHTIDPGGAELRFPVKKTPFKVRGQLKAVGPMEEVHCDGHEKLGSKALRMGPVGIPIYGFRDHIGMVLYLTVVPNDRNEETIGHVYLDFVEVTGEMPVQLTFDGGTETGLMKAIQQELRCAFLTELDRPSTVALKSTDNIPIESLWSYWQTYAGRNIKHTLLQGNANGLFSPGNPNHVNLFQWLWPRIVQCHLNEFHDYWNTTPRRSQKVKTLPTVAPEMVFNYPERYNMLHCGTTVPAGLIKELRATHLNKTRAEVMEWVPQEFDELASAAYELIESPVLHYTTGWSTFGKLIEVIESL
ncbi:hypothetical protein K438DRAFT_1599635 [Mycena galopus ATCC 62051]|nr:hypothetical protein K438DRAFT_1599635 [Mycena galopus ATCC 62051]